MHMHRGRGGVVSYPSLSSRPCADDLNHLLNPAHTSAALCMSSLYSCGSIVHAGALEL